MSDPTTNTTRDSAALATRPTAWWGDRGVRTKTLTAVGVTAAVAVGVGVMGISALGDTADATQDLYRGNVKAIAGANEMVEALDAARLASRNAILAPTPELTEEVLAGFPEVEEAFHAGLETYLAAGPTEEQRAQAEAADAQFDEYFEAVQRELVPFAGDVPGRGVARGRGEPLRLEL
jgi:hypothetical protein